MKHAFYPAVFHYEDNGYWVEFPDLPGCVTQGDTIEESIAMAKEALELYLFTVTEDRETVNPPSDPTDFKTSGKDFVSFIEYDEADYLHRIDNRAVKKTLTIPAWLNTLAKEHNLNFSNILQNALRRELHLEHA